MTFDFDSVPERAGTDSQKWQKYAGRDILPMWVADMDFPSPPAIREALHRRVDHGIFGYSRPVPSTVSAVLEMLADRYNWHIEKEWLIWLPGLVCGLNVTALALGEPGDAILTATPIYPPFLTAPRNAGRQSVAVPMVKTGDRWEFDWQAMEQAVTPQTRAFFLCNPQNPTGRVFSRAELVRLAEFCERHDLVLCSDEIHCDLILDPVPHHPIATLSPEVANRTITLMAPSKTYNIPGLGCSFAIISNERIRRAFLRATAGIVAEVNIFGYVACEAAYRDSEPWRRELIHYLRANRDLVLDFAARHLPGVETTPIEATYLAWFNVEKLGLKDPVAFFEEAGVGLSDGRFFGSPGHVRLNYGCPRATLTEGLRRMQKALERKADDEARPIRG